MIIVRRMIEKDIPEVALLYKQFWNEDSCIECMYNQFNKLSKTGTHILLNAVEDECVIGSVMGIICEELYGQGNPFMVLENMIVDKRYRNKGIGKILVAELEKIALVKKCTQIILVTETERVDACKFYESVGYNPTKNKGFKKKLQYQK